MSEIIQDTKSRMKKSIENLSRELANISAGRANSNLLNGVNVDYYGAPTPVQQLASINVPEARLLVISPYDKSSVADIEKAIIAANLGVNPTSDGEVIRITVPALTEERRKELVKNVKKIGEDSKVSIRNIRRDINDQLKKDEKNGDITEDDLRSQTEDVQKVTDNSIKEIDNLVDEKEKDIMSV
ncbi:MULTISPECIES: ribosome recycling factor [Staphylococcus]|jgi:ribosome recycling factor|uniref:Ribosome-recycling factor n=1 Tax=Staphylococcus hominis TaxID=1290 RepID=A0A2A1MEA4_STAHO|nr:MULTISPECIES: ribosome recycling factor [Staphylococcus]EUZ70215.1 ribosome-recycling factor [Staphylococcus sp. M0480]OFK82692.1 ribosome recycling factor [Staphylococcus sp. HMSC057A02]OFM60046.1 ribosome recycling factor [Staphylococcus sp. HMSC059G05]OFM63808.1 ribosome recycling factor [Staphylococcus sp. HMSC062C01]OFM64982.1 ribosome recycling factor [Staphylococcus sp. HMSC068D07]OFM79560.1 ribosome recycling factor [Staphylococcus sp. HMSC074B09]OFM95810.1 ribosome recycling fact